MYILYNKVFDTKEFFVSPPILTTAAAQQKISPALSHLTSGSLINIIYRSYTGFEQEG